MIHSVVFVVFSTDLFDSQRNDGLLLETSKGPRFSVLFAASFDARLGVRLSHTGTGVDVCPLGEHGDSEHDRGWHSAELPDANVHS